MLIDHGMDSITAVINTMLITTLVQTGMTILFFSVTIGNNMICILGLLAATMPFYYAVLEQYYTGELILGKINGIDEGSFVYIFVCFLAGYYGNVELFTMKFTILGHTATLGNFIGYLLIGSAIPQVIPK